MHRTVRSILFVLLATVLLLAIGMLTRMPAMRLGINYGLHAVLAAFFYGLAVAAFEMKTARAFPIAIGAIIFGALLGRMSPVMAVAACLPALVYLVVYILTHTVRSTDGSRYAIVGGTVFAAFAYVGTILGGALFSGYTPSVADLPFLLLSVGLGLLGSIAGVWLAGKLGKGRA